MISPGELLFVLVSTSIVSVGLTLIVRQKLQDLKNVPEPVRAAKLSTFELTLKNGDYHLVEAWRYTMNTDFTTFTTRTGWIAFDTDEILIFSNTPLSEVVEIAAANEEQNA